MFVAWCLVTTWTTPLLVRVDKRKPVVYEEWGRSFSADDSWNKKSQEVITEVGDSIRYHVILSVVGFNTTVLHVECHCKD